MTYETSAPEQSDLESAPPVRAADELRVLKHTSITLTAHVLGPRGIIIDASIIDATYDGLKGTALRAIAFEKELIAQGLKPISPVTASPAATPQQQAAAPPASQSGQGPVRIEGENGKPPRCSIHGAMKWLEGTAKQGPKTGEHYEFWACTQRDCRPAVAKP